MLSSDRRNSSTSRVEDSSIRAALVVWRCQQRYNRWVTESDLTPIVITPEPVVLNLSPDAFHLWATDFLKAARDFRQPSRFSPVPYFLICRAIELEIKSRHLVESRQVQVKRKYGHSLLKAYNGLEASQKVLTPEEVQVLSKASESYDLPNKHFEYWSPAEALRGYSRFPSLEALTVIAAKLIEP